MSLSACLNCQQCITHHCEANPIYFGVHEVIKKTFEGETLKSVAEKLEACPHWSLADNKEVTAQLTFSLKQWHDCLEQLRTGSSASEVLREIEQTAAHALDPTSDRNVHELLPSSSGDPAAEVPPDAQLADEVVSVDASLSIGAEPAVPIAAEIEKDDAGAVDAPPAAAVVIAPTPVPDQPASKDDNLSEKPLQSGEDSLQSAPASVVITASSSPLQAKPVDEPATAQQFNQSPISAQTVEHSINALINDFWSTNALRGNISTEDYAPQAKSWRGSGRSIQPM